MLSVPCFNMTGPMIEPGQKAPEELTLRIDKPTRETGEQQLSGELPVPYIFIRHPPTLSSVHRHSRSTAPVLMM
jgi:hypothetical protein